MENKQTPHIIVIIMTNITTLVYTQKNLSSLGDGRETYNK